MWQKDINGLTYYTPSYINQRGQRVIVGQVAPPPAALTPFAQAAVADPNWRRVYYVIEITRSSGYNILNSSREVIGYLPTGAKVRVWQESIESAGPRRLRILQSNEELSNQVEAKEVWAPIQDLNNGYRVVSESVEAVSEAAATPRYMSPADFVRVWYEVQPQPGTVYGEKPPILGDVAADNHIRNIAESRGYRLQPLSVSGDLHPATVQAFNAMATEARRAGIDLFIVSGYRSPDTQREIFMARLTEYYGRRPTAEEVARGAADSQINRVLDQRSIPGYSRHHSGYVIDLNRLDDSFVNTPAYQWLSADNYRNARKFGFIPSYPPGVRAGPLPESWEFSFISDTSRVR